MNVAKYTFQSPYSSQVQVGRLDPSSTKETSSSSSDTTLFTNKSQTQPQAKEVETTSEVSSDENRLLDTYA